MPTQASSGWVYISDIELEEIAECDCELCGRITAEGTLDIAEPLAPVLESMEDVNGRLSNAERHLQLVVDDYDRRRESWWGRFLLWLLRKTT